MSLVTLTSDFGYRDHYVGAMKGAILAINPQAAVIDLTHAIPTCDIQAGAFTLWHAAREFPPGTVHLAVVDPGVGGPRRGLVLRACEVFWVGPDNGLFHFALSDPTCEAFEIAASELIPGTVSSTFHGRDIFAPIAAHLTQGIEPREVGPPIADPARLDIAPLVQEGNLIRGEIISVDRFGNLITNIARANLREVRRPLEIRVGSCTVTGLRHTYGDAEPGVVLALLGSSDRLEISVNQGSAASQLGLQVGDPVTVEYR